MPYETIIGWRYLHRGKPPTYAVIAFALSLLATAGGAVFLLVQGEPSPAAVLQLAGSALLATFFGILCLFSVFTAVSVIGVVLGVAALTIVLSVTSGFQQQFRDKVLGVNAHVLVMKSTQDFANYREVEQVAGGLGPHVAAVQPFVFVEMLITRGTGELSGIAMKGIDPARAGQVLDLPQHMVEGTVDVLAERPTGPGEAAAPPIIIGRELARKLKAKRGDLVTLVLPDLRGDFRSWGTAKNPPKTRKFRVAGLFYSGFDEYDRRLVYVGLREAQDFLGEGDVVTGVELKLADVDRARATAQQLDAALGGEPYVVMDWYELNHNLFTALTLQKVVIVIILTLIIIVAAFNMVAALTMMVLDKTKEIAILKSMGSTSAGIAGIFKIVGLTIGGIGTAVGLGLGLTLCGVMSRYGYPLDPKVYLIDRLPIRVSPYEVAMIGAITLAICVLASIYPAYRASTLRPVEGLRYE